MIFDRTPVRFRKNSLYKSLSYIVNITLSESILVGDLHCISFFGDEASDIVFDKTPNRIYKDARSDCAEL